MPYAEKLYRPNHILFNYYNLKTDSSGTLEDYSSEAVNRRMKKERPSFFEVMSAPIKTYQECSKKRKDLEKMIWKQMNLLVSNSGLQKAYDSGEEYIAQRSDNLDLFNKRVNDLSNNFKKCFGLRLRGESRYFKEIYEENEQTYN